MADYKISLGVDVQVSDIRKRISEYNANSNNAKLKLGVKLDTKGLSNQIRAINSKTPVKLSIKLNTTDAQRQINNIKKQIQQLGKIKINLSGAGVSSSGASSSANNIKQTTNELKKIQLLAREIGRLDFKMGTLDTKANVNQIKELERQLELLKIQYNETAKSLNNSGVSGISSVTSKEFVDARNKLAEFDAKLADTKTKLASGIKANFGNYDNQILSLENRFDSLANKAPEVKRGIEGVKQALANLKSANEVDDLIVANDRYKESINKVRTALEELELKEKGFSNETRLNTEKEAAMRRLNSLFENGSAAAKIYGAEVERLRKEINDCGNIKGVQNLNKQITALGREIRDTHVQTQTFAGRIKNQWQRYSTYFSVASVIMYGTQAMKSMFEQVKLIDSAMTELKKVTDESDASYNQFLKNAASRSKILGTTIDGLVGSTADFARLGYSFEDSQGLAEVANIYAVVGDEIESVEDATQSLVSTLAAFKDEMNDMSNTEFAMSIVDKMNEVANNYAISSGGLGEALQRSASSMAAANNTLDETIAMITAANEVAQNPEKVGNAMKTISMRIRGAKTELEEAGESTDGMVESTAKLREEIMALSGVDIMLDKNTFKSTYQIMDELATKWEDLSDIAQASIIELMAGKHQGNIFASLMTNFDTAREALNTSINSSGSAMAEHAKWSESLEARLNKLKAAWQSLSQAFMKSDLLKLVLDGVIGLVDGITKLIDALGALGTTGVMVGVFALFKNWSVVMLAAKKAIVSLAMSLTLSGGLATAIAVVKTAISGLWGVIASNPILATVAAIGAIIVAYNHFTESAEELAERIDDVTTKYKDRHSELSKLKGDYDTSNEDSMISRYEELSKGVSNLGENIALTTDEYAEYQNIVEQIASTNPELIAGYDSQGNAILSCAGDVDALAESYKNLIKEQNIEFLTGKDENDKLKNSFSNAKDIVRDFNNDLNKEFDGISHKGAVDGMNWLENIIGKGALSEQEIKNAVDNLSGAQAMEISRLIEENGIKRDVLGSGDWGYETFQEHIVRAVKENKSEIDNTIKEVRSNVDSYAESLGAATGAYFDQAFLGGDETLGIKDYSSKISDRIQGILNQTASELDGISFIDIIGDADTNDAKWQALTDFYNSTLDAFANMSKSDAAKFEAAFDLKTKFNGGEISYGEYVNGLQDVGELIDSLGLSEEFAGQIKLNLGLNEDGIVEEYQHLNNRLVNMTTENWINFSGASEAIKIANNDVKEFLNSLSAQELSVLTKIIPKFTPMSNEDISKELDRLESGGSVDLHFRPRVDSSVLKDAGWEDVGEGAATVFTSTFSNAAGDIAMNFTPIVVDEKGKHVDTLSPDALQEYAESVIAGTREDDLNLQIGAEFSGKNAIKEAENAAEYIHSLQDYYYNGTLAQINDAVRREMLVNGLGFDFNIEAETTWVETLNTALEESASVTGLTSESIKSLTSRYKELDEFDAEKLFERTAHGVKLNEDAVSELESSLKKKNKTELDSRMSELQDEYYRLTEEIKGAGDTAKRAELYADRDAIVDQINDIANLISQYDGLTSAYNNWINAQAGKDKGDTYSEVMGSMESAKELYESGHVGTNEFKASAQFLSYDDLSDADIDTIVDKWVNGKKKFDKYFTEDESGSENFLNDLNSINESWANLENGEWSVDIDIDEAAKEMGVSTSFIMTMLDELEARGIKINYEDDSLKEFKKQAEEAQEIYNQITGEGISFKFGTGDIKRVNSQLDEAKLLYDTLITKDGKVNLDVAGAKEFRTVILGLIKEKQQLEKPAIMDIEVSAEDAETDVGKAVKSVQSLQDNLWKLEQSDYDLTINSDEVKTEIGEIVTTLAGIDPTIYASLGLNDAEIANLKTAIESIQTSIKTGAEVDPAAVETVKSTIQGIDATVVTDVLTGGSATVEPTPSTTYLGDGFTGDATITSTPDTLDLGDGFVGTATITVSPNKTDFGNIFSGTASITPSLTQTHFTVTVGTGPGEAGGTAHANGSAFANGTSGRAFKQGDWSIKGSGMALGGELGQELVVRDGHFFTIGDKGAEFFHYKPNDIIFNAAQTESLFKYGGIKGAKPRGTMLATGSAFVDGNAFAYTAGGKGKLYGNTVTGKTYGSKDSNSKSKSNSKSNSDEDFEEVIDWIEIIIDRVERAIDKFEQQANNIYKTWSSRNEALLNQTSEVQNEIDLQQQAYDKYISAANGVGLEEKWAEKVRNGKIDIETITDETLKEKIDDYKQWYEKALDCEKAVEDLKETESELYAQRFEHIQSEYDGVLQGYEHTKTMLEEYISQAEERGHIVSKNYYQALIDNEKDNISELEREQADLIASRDEAVASGKIEKYSEEWYNMCNEIDEVTQAIEESATAILEYDNAMREIDWSVFDLIQERISGVAEETDFLIELMSNKKLFDDDGKLTSQGLATMGLHAQNYNSYMYQADTYGEEIANLDAQIAKDPYDQELINRRNELLELQRESILAAEEEKNAIRDMVEEGINLELDALQERIDKYNESIDAAKDLYDYQKNVKKQSEEIASLEKQRAAYLGDDSEEGKSKLQEIEVSLKEAKEELQDTEYERYISDQQALLDTLYNEYELILNQRLDNVDYLLEQVIDSINSAAGADGDIALALGSEGAIAIAVNSNATSIKDTLAAETNKVGITLSNAMNSIWNTGDGNAKSVLTMYGEDFKTKSTTIITTLNSIKTSVDSMVAASNKEATAKTTANKTTTSAKKNPTTNATKKTTTKKSDGDGVPKIGDRVKYVSGQYYYDSQGKKPLGTHKQGEYVYITNINNKDWATHGYHISTGSKLGNGDLGWLKLNQLSEYAVGKKNIPSDELAWTQEDWKNKGREFIVRPSDGAILTPVAESDSILTSVASNNIWDMANSPAEFIKDNLKLDANNVPNNSTVQGRYTQNLENVVFNFPNVKNYDEFLSALKKDRSFEHLIQSMTIDQIAGKSSLGKGKSIK